MMLKPISRSLLYLLVLWLLMACAPTVMPPSSPLNQPQVENPAVLTVRQALTQQLQADQASVTVVGVEEKQWPNACLGAPQADELCLQVLTPGYRITLRVNENEYVYHTNEDGSAMRLVAAPEAAIGDPVLTWTDSNDAGCQTLSAGPNGIAFGACGGRLMGVPYGANTRRADLAEFVNRYQSFTAETPAGTVEFVGTGGTVATTAEQRMLAEWARLVYWEAQGGRSGASWGLIFAWHREGGLAGFCEDVTVYVTGEAYVTSCRGNQPEDLGRVRLDATQLATVYSWVDTLQSFETGESDAGVADSLTIRMVFSGAGTTPATEADQQAITDLAQALIAQVTEAAGREPVGVPTADTLNYFSPVGGFSIAYPAAAAYVENARPSVDGAIAQAENTVAFTNSSPHYVLTITWFDLADRTVLQRFVDAYSDCAALVSTEGQPFDINGQAGLLFPEVPCGPYTTTYIFTVFELRGYRISIETPVFYTEIQAAVEPVVASMQFQPPALPGDDAALCPVLAERMQTLTNAAEGYCFLYPMDDYVVVNTGPRALDVVRYSLLNPVDPRVSVSVEDVGGRTLEEVAVQFETDYSLPGSPVERNLLTVDGVPAVMFDNLPGQDFNRRVAFIANGRLFSLFFIPLGEPGPAREAMEQFYQDVITTWRFIPASGPASGPVSEPVDAGVPSSDTGEALIESLEIHVLESDPVQVQVVVRGQLPDACAFIEQTEVVTEGNTFRIHMTVARQPNQRCAPMLTPFEEIVPLELTQPATGTYEVRSNDLVESFTLGN